MNSPPILDSRFQRLDWLIFTGGTIWVLTHGHMVLVWTAQFPFSGLAQVAIDQLLRGHAVR